MRPMNTPLSNSVGSVSDVKGFGKQWSDCRYHAAHQIELYVSSFRPL